MFTIFPKKSLALSLRADEPEFSRIASRVQCWEQSAGQLLKRLKPSDFVVLGYPDDRGVERNYGRIGSAEAPDEIRRILYSMTFSSEAAAKTLNIYDLGNLKTWSMGLLEAHDEARKFIDALRATGARIITLGGGNDWAFSDFAGLGTSGKDSKAAHLVSFDAHLDVRPNPEDTERQGHSGTPFRRILEGCGRNENLKVSMIGLQRHCNAPAYFKWAEAMKITLCLLEEMPLGTDTEQLRYLKDRVAVGAANLNVGLSIDMDAFGQGDSPGVSAPQAVGLKPEIVLNFIRDCGTAAQQLGIYEANPRVDRDSQTSRLAAKLIFEFLSS